MPSPTCSPICSAGGAQSTAHTAPGSQAGGVGGLSLLLRVGEHLSWCGRSLPHRARRPTQCAFIRKGAVSASDTPIAGVSTCSVIHTSEEVNRKVSSCQSGTQDQVKHPHSVTAKQPLPCAFNAHQLKPKPRKGMRSVATPGKTEPECIRSSHTK